MGSRSMREFQLARLWVGRPSEELVRAWGSPRLQLNVPGLQPQQSFIMVFFDRDPVGGCIDAFVVGLDAGRTISNYICR